MSGSATVFVTWVCLALLAWIAGQNIGRQSRRAAALAGLIGVISLAAWAWLVRHPATAVRLVPADVLQYIEGVAALPLLMFALAALRHCAQTLREQVAIALATVAGCAYFAHGGWWMLQQTPRDAFLSEINQPFVWQSTEYSCVPASSATVLNLLGHPTSEARMAELTQTRPVTGATIVRALAGLEQRLQTTSVRPRLVNLRHDDLDELDTPALALMRLEHTRQHLVVVVDVTPRRVLLADPTNGSARVDRDWFERRFTGDAIVFDEVNRPAAILAQARSGVW